MIAEAVENRDISMLQIDEKVRRILKFKEKYIKLDFEESYQDVKHIVENQESKDFAYEIVKEAMTYVKGVPVNLNKKTLLVASAPVSTTVADEDDGRFSIINTVKRELPEIDTCLVSVKLDQNEIDKVVEKSKEYEQVVYCSYNANIFQNQLELIRKLNAITDLHVIAMRNPYDSLFVPEIRNLVLMYEYTPNAVKALIGYLKREVIPNGMAPVRL